EIVFTHVPGDVAGVGARRADGHETAHIVACGDIEEVRAHQDVAVKNLCRLGDADAQAAVVRCRVDDDSRANGFKRVIDGNRIEQVEFGQAGSGDLETVSSKRFHDPPTVETACA